MVVIPVQRLNSDLPLPNYAKPGDAGADLIANEEVTLAPGGGRALIGTGIAVAIPPGYAGFVQPRSGLALRHGITCLNTPGLIDSGYRDELKVLLVNTDPSEPYEVHQGDRIAQLVIQKVEEVAWEEADELDDTERGLGGFGHSGR
ncbi:MAG: dUTP diphosphatase [Acidimicrobiales bacterium]|nr:dUTP diphosphatase [Acidimicrobiales bacterium]MDP6902338.1 dUTP diphosphatase [Acidimicrobiales bacterium]HJL98561.1 dUTP diphosphatase [Acidimicrobiales bacterium]